MNHIEWTEQKIMVLKPANKYQIIQQCHHFKNILIGNFHHHPFLYQAKVYIIFYEAENNKLKRQDNLTIQTFIYYLIYPGTRKAFRKIMQPKET